MYGLHTKVGRYCNRMSESSFHICSSGKVRSICDVVTESTRACNMSARHDTAPLVLLRNFWSICTAPSSRYNPLASSTTWSIEHSSHIHTVFCLIKKLMHACIYVLLYLLQFKWNYQIHCYRCTLYNIWSCGYDAVTVFSSSRQNFRYAMAWKTVSAADGKESERTHAYKHTTQCLLLLGNMGKILFCLHGKDTNY